MDTSARIRQIESYDKLAPAYVSDSANLEQVRMYMMRLAFGNLPVDCSFIDVGCGVGECIRVLKTLGYFNVFGIDFSQEMVTRARQHSESISLLNFQTDKLPTQWPAGYDCVMGIAFIHMFSSKEVDNVLRKMFSLASRRVYITTTLHLEDREGLIEKQMSGLKVIRFRREYTLKTLLNLCEKVCPKNWEVLWWRMTCSKGKDWVNVLFHCKNDTSPKWIPNQFDIPSNFEHIEAYRGVSCLSPLSSLEGF